MNGDRLLRTQLAKTIEDRPLSRNKSSVGAKIAWFIFAYLPGRNKSAPSLHVHCRENNNNTTVIEMVFLCWKTQHDTAKE